MPPATLIVALTFAIILLRGPRSFMSERTALSIGAGVSVAYVFIHMLPELSEASRAFVDVTAGTGLPTPAYRVYSSALIGFLAFYGLEHMVRWSRLRAAGGKDGRDVEAPPQVALVQFVGFSLYVGLVGYLLVDSVADDTDQRLALYAIAMSLHFLCVERSLRTEHPTAFDGAGKYMLAAAALAGWGIAVLTEFSKPFVITVLGFVSGGVVMNSMVMELPGQDDGRYWPFVIGAIFYAMVLIETR